MKEKHAGVKSNLRKVDRHVITEEEYKEIPELTEEFFEKAQMYEGDKPISRRTRGKQKKPTKVQKTIRLDGDVIDFFQREKGRGWQTEINDVLLKYVEEKRKSKKRA